MVSSPVFAPAPLASLNQALASQLQPRSPHPGLTVNCLEHQGRLWVVGQHRAPEASSPAVVLRALEQHLYTALAMVSLAGSPWETHSQIPVRLLLQLKGAQQPYAMHTFTWRLEDTVAIVFPDLLPTSEVEDSAVSDASSGALGDQPRLSPWPESPFPSPEAAGSPAVPMESAPIAPDDPSLEPRPEPSLAPPSIALALWGEVTPPPPPSASPRPAPGLPQWLCDYWSYGAVGMILAASGLFALALTRPCVVGVCDRLTEAKAYSGDAYTTLAQAPNGTTLTTAQADLQRAIHQLAPIPAWSGAYAAAQADLQRYRRDLRAVQAILQAQTTATQAADLSQNPPHTVERWVTIHQLWQQAMDRLATVPNTSPVFDYAQKKHREYQANHSAIERRIVAEEEAEATFNTALQTGLLAERRTETANSLAGWHLAITEWQAAIQDLSLIPRGTLIYEQAQDQMREYQQRLQRTLNRSHLEDTSTHYHDQALRAARAAAAYEAQGQWSLAVSHWQQAVTSAQRIPSDARLAEEGALLLDRYQPALQNAQTRLRSAVALQTLTTTLGSLCANTQDSCTVREDPNQIHVTLANAYADSLRRAITLPAAQGSLGLTQELTPQTQALINQVTSLSHQVNRQVAIYDGQGRFVARYRPDVGGFVRN